MSNSRPTPPQMTNAEVLNSPSYDDVGIHSGQSMSRLGSEEDYVMTGSYQDAEELPCEDSDFRLAFDIQETLGPISDYDGDDQDSTLPWTPHDFTTTQVYCNSGVVSNEAAKTFDSILSGNCFEMNIL